MLFLLCLNCSSSIEKSSLCFKTLLKCYFPNHFSKPKIDRLFPHQALNVVMILATSSLVGFSERG